MNDIRKKSNLMINLLKFTSNKKILSKVIVLDYNLVKLCPFNIQLGSTYLLS